ncbi:hypothetical protein CEXT_5851 [Caerostris extrusa]|uniref:Uncharacterized protein n=1 Tax=Caerostris extrusa TaxID=172846 RepID=A0AAV4SWJ3_CAEEX|nr:hypothetical protein CEXT_5851 [Caerostris extrusa]
MMRGAIRKISCLATASDDERAIRKISCLATATEDDDDERSETGEFSQSPNQDRQGHRLVIRASSCRASVEGSETDCGSLLTLEGTAEGIQNSSLIASLSAIFSRDSPAAS